MAILRRQLGEYELAVVGDGWWRIDGGAMFGVAPRVRWERRYPPDERNRVLLRLNPLLVRAPGGYVLIDTGVGHKYDQAFIESISLARPPELLASLREYGIGPEEVRWVILTHLHFDHAGGATRFAGEPRAAEPTFPKATYVVQEVEWQDFRGGHERLQSAYDDENMAAVEARGQLQLVDGSHEVLPGITCHRTGGHTRGHQIVEIAGGGETALYLGDLVPTVGHLNPLWTTAWDNFPLDTVEQRQRWLSRARDGRWLLVFDHDPQIEWGMLAADPRRFRLENG